MITMPAVSARPARNVLDSLGEELPPRLTPSGVISKAQARTMTTGNPKMRSKNYQLHGGVRNLKERKNLRGHLNEQPGDDRVSDSDLVKIAPL